MLQTFLEEQALQNRAFPIGKTEEVKLNCVDKLCTSIWA